MKYDGSKESSSLHSSDFILVVSIPLSGNGRSFFFLFLFLFKLEKFNEMQIGFKRRPSRWSDIPSLFLTYFDFKREEAKMLRNKFTET